MLTLVAAPPSNRSAWGQSLYSSPGRERCFLSVKSRCKQTSPPMPQHSRAATTLLCKPWNSQLLLKRSLRSGRQIRIVPPAPLCSLWLSQYTLTTHPAWTLAERCAESWRVGLCKYKARVGRGSTQLLRAEPSALSVLCKGSSLGPWVELPHRNVLGITG